MEATSHPVPIDRPDRCLREEIARQAEELWRHYWQPVGRDIDIWLEAEREMLGADPLVRAEGGGAVSAAQFTASNETTAPVSQPKA